MAYDRVVIVGGGFGGINAAKELSHADVNLTLIDMSNHHLFQPLLYQVASAALSPGNIAAPIREILRRQENSTVIMAHARRVDLKGQCVYVDSGDSYPYDHLILAPGAHHSYFHHPEWEEFAPGLKTISDAIRIRERILMAFERAEQCDSFRQSSKYLRFIVIGGGPTGVEMVGAIAEIAHKTLFKNFRKIRPEQSEIYLVEGGPRILAAYPESLSVQAQRDLEKMGVKVLVESVVTQIDRKGVYINERLFETRNIIWAAGNQASPLLTTLGVPLDTCGRVPVQRDLSVEGYPNAFVIGDAAHVAGASGEPLPAIAPVAIQQGSYVARVIAQKMASEKRTPFRYRDKGMMATIGKAKAVVVVGRWKFHGFFAWMAWVFIHIFYLVSFENRILVMTQWLFWYCTGKRQQRLITRPTHYHDEHVLEEQNGGMISVESRGTDGPQSLTSPKEGTKG